MRKKISYGSFPVFAGRRARFVLLAACILCTGNLFPAWAADTTGFRRWGYLHHASPLSQEYLHASLPMYSVVALTGFSITRDGGLRIDCAGYLKNILALCAQYNVTLYPVITLDNVAAGRKVLASPELSTNTIAAIGSLVRRYRFPGVHCDIEYLPGEDAPRLAAFLGSLKKHLAGKKLSMALFPSVDFPRNYAACHALTLIAPLLDEAVIMCYDYHGPRHPQGPVTDLAWAKLNIEAALVYFRPETLWMGIPAYGYQWEKTGKATAVSARHGTALCKKNNPVRHASGCLTCSVTDKGRVLTLYVSDAVTRSRMENLARSLNLTGTALWRLGFEE